MIKRKQARFYLNLITVATIIGGTTTITTVALIIAYSFLGFGLRTNPITCSSSLGYFTTKYNQENYLNVINIAMLIASTSALILAVLVLYLRYKITKSEPKDEYFKSWTDHKQHIMFVLTSICEVTLILSNAWFLSFWIQVSAQCGVVVQISWILIVLFGSLSFIAYLITAISLFKIRQQFEPQQIVEQEEDNKSKTSIKPQTSKIPEKQSSESPEQLEKQPKVSIRKQKSEVEDIIESQEEAQVKKQMNKPLLPPQPNLKISRSRKWDFPDSEYENERKRLKEVQAKRRAEQQRLEELERKKSYMNHSQNKQPVVKTQKEENNQKGNQTIINIHLTGSQSTPNTTLVQKSPKQNYRQLHRTKKSRFRPPVYEQESQFSQYVPRRYHPRRQYDQDPSRFYERERYRPKQESPYFNNRNPINSQPIEPQKLKSQKSQSRKLTIGHTADVHIGPFISPVANNAIPASNNFQFSQVNQILSPAVRTQSRQPPTFKKQQSNLKVNQVPPQKRQDDSFVQKLMGQSTFQPPIPILRAPKKSKPKKQLTQLEAYIKALNKNMKTYEENQSDSEISYSSILSQFERRKIQPQRQNYTRSQLREQFRNASRMRESWITLQKKIDQKYKQK